jgi:prevent-host-death family protein
MNHKISATEAKNRFGAICALAKQGPVLVAKDGRPDTVILSASLYEQLIKSSSGKEESKEEAAQRFAEKHKEFIRFWTEETEAQGTWSDGLRTW